MQMGRWFGYRPGYLDLCRLYTTAELCEWFGHISDATTELRAEFDLMANSGGTPKDYGLRVRSHPVLMVTSRVKMRSGKRVPVTFSGKAPETNNFYRDPDSVENNWRALRELLRALDGGAGALTRPPRETNSVYWTDVGVEAVLAFLENYKEHEAAYRTRTKPLADYIRSEYASERLREWHVLLSGGGGDRRNIEGHEVSLVRRSWKLPSGRSDDRDQKEEFIRKNRFSIGILTSPEDEAVGLSDNEKAGAIRAAIAAWENDPKGRDGPPTAASGQFYRSARSRHWGVLILYPLQPDRDKSEKGDTPLVGFTLSFPAVPGAEASQATYTVNNVYQRVEMSQ